MIIDRSAEEAIRQIVREEIAADEMRRQEAPTSNPYDAVVPGGLNQPPGTLTYVLDGRTVSRGSYFAGGGQ